MSHADGQFPRQIPTAQVDIEQGGLYRPMSGKGSNLMDVPAGAGQVSQAKVPECMGCEPPNVGTSGDREDDLRP